MSNDQDQAAGGRSKRRKGWVSLLRIAFILLLGIALLMWFERLFIFFPDRYPQGDWNPVGLAFEDAHFTADDGTKLHGWYVPHKNPRAVILYCHGNAGNITHRSGIMRVLNQYVGASVLAFDYRGYGRSEGKPSEKGILSDARAARAWLAKKEGIDEKDVVLMGRSLGGAVAVDLAAKDGAKALVLESTFTSIPDMAAYHYPALPIGWLIRTRLDSLSKIADYHGPLLHSHGDADITVPFENGQRLFEAANEPKQFIPLPHLGHNESLPPSYYDEMIRFFDSMN